MFEIEMLELRSQEVSNMLLSQLTSRLSGEARQFAHTYQQSGILKSQKLQSQRP
jgi:hypothetical protein